MKTTSVTYLVLALMAIGGCRGTDDPAPPIDVATGKGGNPGSGGRRAPTGTGGDTSSGGSGGSPTLPGSGGSSGTAGSGGSTPTAEPGTDGGPTGDDGGATETAAEASVAPLCLNTVV